MMSYWMQILDPRVSPNRFIEQCTLCSPMTSVNAKTVNIGLGNGLAPDKKLFIILANVEPVLCRYMGSLYYNTTMWPGDAI